MSPSGYRGQVRWVLTRPLVGLLWLLQQLVSVLMLPVRRLGQREWPLVITAYRGIGNEHQVRLRGRVQEDTEAGRPKDPGRSRWARLATLYRRLASRGVAGARVMARLGSAETEAVSDESGFFSIVLAPAEPLPKDRQWVEVALELLSPRPQDGQPVTATGAVLIPPRSAQFIVISDIDDTVVYTGVANKLKMLWRLFAVEAEGRVAFPGVPSFYRALHAGQGKVQNPLVYVSRGPWSLYQVLERFFHLHRIPVGPVLFLRDWGVTPRHPLPKRAPDHKMDLIEEILESFAPLPVLLIGDSGQKDPEVYYEAVNRHPERVLAVYIRNVSAGTTRPEAIRALGDKVVQAGSALILASDTLSLAEHAAQNGWIDTVALDVIASEVERQRPEEAPVEPTQTIEPRRPAADSEAVAEQRE